MADQKPNTELLSQTVEVENLIDTDKNTQKKDNKDTYFYDNISADYEQLKKDKIELLNNLPQVKFAEDNQDFEYFSSAYQQGLQKKKEFLHPEESVDKLIQSYNIEEYGTNYPTDLYDPKQIEQIIKQETEVKIPQKQQSSVQQQVQDLKKKSKWDNSAVVASMQQPAIQQQPQFANYYKQPNFGQVVQNSVGINQQYTGYQGGQNPYAQIANFNRAFVEKQ